MFKELVKVFSHSVVYGFTGVLSTFISIFLVPIYTRILTPTDYGVIAILTTLSSIILVFAGMGMGTAVFWAYFRAKGKERKEVVFTSFVFQTLFPLLITLAFYFSAGTINRLLFSGFDYTFLVKLSAWALFFNAGVAIPLALLRAEGAPSKYVTVTLFKALIAVLLSIWFVVFLRWGVAGAFWANLWSAVLGYAFSLVFTIRRMAFKFSSYWLKEILRYGVPMMPAGLAMWALNSSDRYFLNAFTSTADVGIYNVGYKVGMFVSLVAGAFQLAYGPFVYSVFNEKDNPKDYYRKITTYLFLLIFLVALAFSIFSKEIIQILTGPKFHSAYVVVPFIAFSYVAHGLHNMFGVGIAVMRKTYYSTIAVLLAGGLNLILNYFLISRFGIMGAATATLLSFLALALIVLKFSQSMYHIKFEFQKITKILLVGGILVYLSTLVNFSLAVSVLIKSLILIVFPVLLYFLGFFEERELKKLAKIWTLVKASRGRPQALFDSIRQEFIT